MASLVYNSYKEDLLNGNIDLTNDTIKLALVTSSYTPDQDAHDFFNDVTNEVSGTGYTAGGKTLSVTVSQDDTDNEGVFDAADVSWTSSTITARGAVIYKDTGNAATSNLICYIDFVTDRSSSNDIFTIQFDAEGILNLT